MQKQRILIFDYDGTLVDSGQDITDAANAARAVFALPPLATENVRQHVGDGIATFVERIMPSEAKEDLGRCLKIFSEIYAKSSMAQSALYPGIRELLDQLKDVPKAVVSNKPLLMLRQMNEALKLSEDFPVALGGDSLPQRKPKPEPLWEARRLAGLAEEALIVMVGDGWQDMDAARAAGATGVWVSWGMQAVKPESADHVIDAPKDLLTLLATI